MPLCLIKICKVIIFKGFSHLWGRLYILGGIFSLMQEILHAWRESGRNSVLPEESLSMRESWKPCRS